MEFVIHQNLEHGQHRSFKLGSKLKYRNKKEYKNNHKFFQKTAKVCYKRTLLYSYKGDKNNLFHEQNNFLKRKDIYLNLNNFNSKNVTTEIRLPLHNLATNITK